MCEQGRAQRQCDADSGQGQSLVGEGHNKEREEKKGTLLGLSYFTPAVVPIVGGSFCSRTGLNL